MSAYVRVPLAWLNVFPFGAFLQVEFAFRVEYMKVDHWMHQATAVVTFTTCGSSYDITFLVAEWQHFFEVIFGHDIQGMMNDESP